MLVFVSKSSQDAAFAQELAEGMDRIGLPVWLSEWDIPEGTDYPAELERALTQQCQAMVVLLSGAALRSAAVKRELELAVSHHIPVLPIVISEDALRVDYPLGYGYLLGITNARQAISDVPTALEIVRRRYLPDTHVTEQGTTRSPMAVQVATKYPKGFVGAARAGLVRELAEIWDQVRLERRARMLVLSAESGYGKTRVVQEFYRVLAAGQAQPPFWPASLTSDQSGHEGLKQSRKLVSPTTLDPDPSAHADYLWIGHVCDEGIGQRIDGGLPAFGYELARAIELAARAAPHGRAAQMAARALRVSQGANVRTAVLELLRRGSSEDAAPGSVEAFWQGIRTLWEPGSDALPIVVAVEDAHHAGTDTVSLMNAVLSSMDMPFLLVACAQGSQLELAGTDQSLGTALQRPLGRLLGEALPAISRRDLTRLDDADVRRLFAEAIPDLDATTLRAAVVKVDGNPYHAQTLLVEMARAASGGKLDADWVQQRPASFEKELSLQWNDLPDLARLGLSAVAVLGTQVPGGLARRALARAATGDPEPAESASIATGWLRRSDRMLRFLERPRWLIAQTEARTELHGDARAAVISESLAYLQGETPHEDQLNRELHLALALAADEEHLPFDRAAAMRSGLDASAWLRLRADHEGAWEVASATERLVADGVPPGMEKVATLSAVQLARTLKATLLSGTNHPLTLAAARSAVQRIGPVTASAPEEAAIACAMLALAQRVRLDPALMELCSQSVAKAMEYLGRCPAPRATTVAEVLTARAGEAFGRGVTDMAASLTQERMAVLEEALGRSDPRVTDALFDLGYYLARLDVSRAVDARSELVRRRRLQWDHSIHPAVAQAEKELASSLARTSEQDRVAEAFDLCLKAVRALEESRGPAQRVTFLARSVLVDVGCRMGDKLEHLGRIDDASALWRDSLTRASYNLRITDTRTASRGYANLRRIRVAMCQVRLQQEAGLAPLEEDFRLELAAASEGTSGPALPLLRSVAQLSAAYIRLGQEARGVALAARHGLVRDERFPQFQPRGWRPTDPQFAKVGVL